MVKRKRKRNRRRKPLSRKAAAKVAAIRRAGKHVVKEELDALRKILESHKGPSNAVSNAGLAAALWGELLQGQRDIARERKLRTRVLQLRKSGCPIALYIGKGNGYFWADGSAESLQALRETSEMFDHRADTSHKIAARLVGMDLIDYQAQRAAAKIDDEAEQEKQEAALRTFVERVTRNPLTMKIFVRVVGERMSEDEKAELEAERAQLAALRAKIREQLAGLMALVA